MKERYVDLFFHGLLCPTGHGRYLERGVCGWPLSSIIKYLQIFLPEPCADKSAPWGLDIIPRPRMGEPPQGVAAIVSVLQAH